MNRLCAAMTTLLFFAGSSPTLLAQSQTYLGFNGSGWPSNLQVRGVIQCSWERKFVAKQFEFGYVRRENITISKALPDGSHYFQPLMGSIEGSALLKFGFKFEQLRIFALFGPSLSRGVEAEALVSYENGDALQMVVPWKQLGIRRWELGTYQGLGIESIGRNGVKIQIDFRYYLGLTDLLPEEKTAYNQGPLLGIVIALPLKHSNEKSGH